MLWSQTKQILLVAAIGFGALHLVLREVHLRDVRASLAAVPDTRIAASLALTVTSYLMLTGLDWVALRAVGKPLPWPIAAAGSFTSYTLSHNLGLSLLTGGSARLRLYSAAGLTFGEVAQVAAICAIALWPPDPSALQMSGGTWARAHDGGSTGPVPSRSFSADSATRREDSSALVVSRGLLPFRDVMISRRENLKSLWMIGRGRLESP